MKKDLRIALLNIVETADSIEDIKKIATEALEKDEINQHASDLEYDTIDAHSYFTVGDLVNFIKDNNINQNGKILVQRIEDVYYEEHNWSTLKVKGEIYYQALQWNKDIDSGKYSNKEQYPHFDMEKHGSKYSEEFLNSLKEEYSVSNQPINYDKNHLYIALHY